MVADLVNTLKAKAKSGDTALPPLLTNRVLQKRVEELSPDVPLPFLAVGAALGGWLPQFLREHDIAVKDLHGKAARLRKQALSCEASSQISLNKAVEIRKIVPAILAAAINLRGTNPLAYSMLVNSVHPFVKAADPLEIMAGLVSFVAYPGAKKSTFATLEAVGIRRDVIQDGVDDLLHLLHGGGGRRDALSATMSLLQLDLIPSRQAMNACYKGDSSGNLKHTLESYYRLALAKNAAKMIADSMTDMPRTPARRRSAAPA